MLYHRLTGYTGNILEVVSPRAEPKGVIANHREYIPIYPGMPVV